MSDLRDKLAEALRRAHKVNPPGEYIGERETLDAIMPIIERRLAAERAATILDWVNWCPDADGIDQRVRNFFYESWEDAYLRFRTILQRDQEKRDTAETDKNERLELARLKTKYEKAQED